MKELLILWMSVQTTVFPLNAIYNRLSDGIAKSMVETVFAPVYLPLAVLSESHPIVEAWLETEFDAWDNVADATIGPSQNVVYLQIDEDGNVIADPATAVEIEPAR